MSRRYLVITEVRVFDEEALLESVSDVDYADDEPMDVPTALCEAMILHEGVPADEGYEIIRTVVSEGEFEVDG